jgi:hypothetical protein
MYVTIAPKRARTLVSPWAAGFEGVYPAGYSLSAEAVTTIKNTATRIVPTVGMSLKA